MVDAVKPGYASRNKWCLRCLLKTGNVKADLISAGDQLWDTVFEIALMVFQGYTIPEGDMLMISPYWAHRNPRFFPNPDEFSPVSIKFKFYLFTYISFCSYIFSLSNQHTIIMLILCWRKSDSSSNVFLLLLSYYLQPFRYRWRVYASTFPLSTMMRW